MTAESAWLPMCLAPRDRPVTLRAERWVKRDERMRVEAFTRCRWHPGGSATRPAPHWRRLPTGWTATHWREEEPR